MMVTGGPAGGHASRAYGEFRVRQLPEHLRPAFDDLREFCMSLGGNVIEDVRLHRVVFCKSMNMRWFADAKPADDSDKDGGEVGGADGDYNDGSDAGLIIVKIRTGWRDPIRTMYIRGGDHGVTQEIRDVIAAAYEAVR